LNGQDNEDVDHGLQPTRPVKTRAISPATPGCSRALPQEVAGVTVNRLLVVLAWPRILDAHRAVQEPVKASLVCPLAAPEHEPCTFPLLAKSESAYSRDFRAIRQQI